MKKLIPIILIIGIVSSLGIKIWQPKNNKKDLTNNLVSLDWRTPLLPEGTKNFDLIRHSCQNKNGLEITLTNIQLQKIDKTAQINDYTFDKKCQNIYAIVNYHNNETIDIFKFSVETGKYTQLTNNLFKETHSIDDAPRPLLIYIINDNKLLVSFMETTTGLSQCQNLMLTQIYDITKNKFTNKIVFADFTEKSEYGFPPMILNFKDNIISQAIQVNNSILIRKDFDLNNEQFLPTVSLNSKLLKDSDLMSQSVCLECYGTEGQVDNNCIAKNLKNIFP